MRRYKTFKNGRTYYITTTYNYKVVEDVPKLKLKEGDDLVVEKFNRKGMVLIKQNYYPELYTQNEKLAFLKEKSSNLQYLIDKFDLDLC